MQYKQMPLDILAQWSASRGNLKRVPVEVLQEVKDIIKNMIDQCNFYLNIPKVFKIIYVQ